MKRIFLIFLVILPVYFIFSLYFLDKRPFISPIVYQRDIVIRSDTRGSGLFGARRDNGARRHNGIDLLAQINTPVLAARSGIVVAAADTRGMGNFVIIRHPGGISTIYGHLAEIYTAKGRLVRQGQVIGLVGKTGNANFPNIHPHLHFEVKKDGIPQDPLPYLE